MSAYWIGTQGEWILCARKEQYATVEFSDDMVNESVKMRPRICSQCGAPIKAYGNYCEYCGVAIS